MSRVAQRAAPRDGPHLQHHGARPDGAKALSQQVVSPWPEYTLILDLLHATASLGDTANARLGATHPHRTAWVRASREARLAGQTDAVIATLEAEGHDPTQTTAQQQAGQRTVGYYRWNRPYMRDDEYVARGWPMGTGVVEGACGHLVNARREPSGMRWPHTGAQGVLDRRAVRLHGHGEA